MKLLNRVLDRKGFRKILLFLVNAKARAVNPRVRGIFYNGGWVHDTKDGYHVDRRPISTIDLPEREAMSKENFLWGYKPAPGDVIIDVGAGVGEEARIFSRAVGDRGKVICVEAHPATYCCLKKSIEYNQLKNVVAVNRAIGDRVNGEVKIEDSQDYLGNRVGENGGIPVKQTTLDEVCREYQLERVSFLKMNIEGAERDAIQGMPLLAQNVEVICISCHDFLAETTGDSSYRTREVVKRFLIGSGFQVLERGGDDPALRGQLWGYKQLERKRDLSNPA